MAIFEIINSYNVEILLIQYSVFLFSLAKTDHFSFAFLKVINQPKKNNQHVYAQYN